VPEFVDLGVKAMRSLCAPAASGCANVNVADSAAASSVISALCASFSRMPPIIRAEEVLIHRRVGAGVAFGFCDLVVSTNPLKLRL
jgi:hypothetical protein